LSDIHIQDVNSWPKNRQDMLLRTLTSFKDKVQHCFIVVTGDIAYNGTKNQYNIAGGMLGCLAGHVCENLGIEEFINTLIVPGNHDIDYTKLTRSLDDISTHITKDSERDIQKFLEKDADGMNDFFDFSTAKRSRWDDKIFRKKVVTFGDTGIAVNMLNTAFFSSIQEDKGYHYFPPKYFEQLFLGEDENRKNKQNIVLTMMHHHPEWLNEKIKLQFEKELTEASSVVFLGHEHESSMKTITWDYSENCIIIAGGVLHDPNEANKSTYNIVVIDTEEKQIEKYFYKWDEEGTFYNCCRSDQQRINFKGFDIDKIKPKSAFLDYLQDDDKRNSISKSFMSYFVFPRLIEKVEHGYIKDSEIVSWEKFSSVLLEKKFLVIIGDENAGKTTLSKYIAYKMLQTKNVLYFSREDIHGKKVDKIIRDVFENQYSEEPLQYAKFNQIDKIYKLAIIEDVNKIKPEFIEDFIIEMKNVFGYIILTSREEWNFDVLTSAKKAIQGDAFVSYTLSEFYADKRKTLIESVCNILVLEKEHVNDVVKSINDFIKTQLSIFKINPNFIVQYVIYFLKNEEVIPAQHDIFSAVFEANIIQAISDHGIRDNIDKVLMVLEEICYYIHLNHCYPISSEKIAQIVDNYNSEYGGRKINVNKLLESLERSRILRKMEDEIKYYFTDNNYLAFFVAKKLYREFINTQETGEVEKILNHICSGINSEIILFLSYITKSKTILFFIMDKAEKYVSAWESYNLNNIKFISNNSRSLDIKNPSDQEKEKAKKAEIMSEKKIRDTKKIETFEIYDDDKIDLENPIQQVLIAIKYMEILARILPNFSYLLKVNEKEKLINHIYNYPNKIIYRCFFEIDKDFENLIDQLAQEIMGKVEKKLTRDQIKDVVVQIGVIVILSIYDRVASIAVNKETIELLRKDAPKSDSGNVTVYDIQKLVMEENNGNIDMFIKQVKSIQRDAKNNILLNNMIALVGRKYLLTKKERDRAKETHLKETIFITKGKSGQHSSNPSRDDFYGKTKYRQALSQ